MQIVHNRLFLSSLKELQIDRYMALKKLLKYVAVKELSKGVALTECLIGVVLKEHCTKLEL